MATRNRWLAVVLTLAFASTIDAQAASTDTLSKKIRLPAPRVDTLKNGLRLIVVETHALPVVSVRLVVPADSLFEPADKPGVSAVTWRALTEGTLQRTREQLDDAQARLGTHVLPTRFTTTSANFAGALGLMADMVMHPAFMSDAIDRAKSDLVDNQKRQLQNSAFASRRAFFNLLYGETHPLARFAFPADIQRITRADVQAFYSERFTPRTSTLIVVGDVSFESVRRSVERAFGTWRGSPTATVGDRLPTPQTTNAVAVLDGPGDQAVVYVGQLGIPRDENLEPAADLLAAILGGNASARIQHVLRETHAFMYSGAPYAVTWRRGIPVAMQWGATIVPAAKIDSVVALWINELRDIRGPRPPTAQEVDVARAARMGSLIARTETTDSIASQFAQMAVNGQQLDSFNRYIEHLQTVSAADVADVAARFIDPGKLTIAISGNTRVLRPLLESAKLGPVVVLDANGKPVP